MRRLSIALTIFSIAVLCDIVSMPLARPLTMTTSFSMRYFVKILVFFIPFSDGFLVPIIEILKIEFINLRLPLRNR